MTHNANNRYSIFCRAWESCATWRYPCGVGVTCRMPGGVPPRRWPSLSTCAAMLLLASHKYCSLLGRQFGQNKLLTILLLVFMLLYVNDHSKLLELDRSESAGPVVDQAGRLRNRTARLTQGCAALQSVIRAERESLYNSLMPLNPCTGTHFAAGKPSVEMVQ